MKKFRFVMTAFQEMVNMKISWKRKAAFVAAALIYIVVPSDVIPDFIPLLGQLDDVAAVLLLAKVFTMYNARLKN